MKTRDKRRNNKKRKWKGKGKGRERKERKRQRIKNWHAAGRHKDIDGDRNEQGMRGPLYHDAKKRNTVY